MLLKSEEKKQEIKKKFIARDSEKMTGQHELHGGLWIFGEVWVVQGLLCGDALCGIKLKHSLQKLEPVWRGPLPNDSSQGLLWVMLAEVAQFVNFWHVLQSAPFI